jgi:Kef-type K+ transport system membrane component KefB
MYTSSSLAATLPDSSMFLAGQLVRRRTLISVAYVLAIAGTLVAFLLIASWGRSLEPVGITQAATTVGAKAAPGHGVALRQVLLSLTVIVLATKVFSRAFKFFGQPPVIGEVLAGIALGPSLLGYLSPPAYSLVLPTAVVPSLSMLSQIGIILYMFTVGLELDTRVLRDRSHAVVAISHFSIVAPFLLGAALALGVYATLAPTGVPFMHFALFLGVAMSITAFPVLARILTDRGVNGTPLGIMALSCAAVDDITAWILLAILVSVVQMDAASSLVLLGGTVAYLATMFLVARPLLVRYAASAERDPRSVGAYAGILLAVLASALAAEVVGIHAIFGGFLVGALIPHHSQIAEELGQRVGQTVSVLLLPAFFALTGMRTQIGLISTPQDWIWCGVITLVATVGKVAGAMAGSRLAGLDWRSSTALGVLMNTRGLMELVVLNIGLELGVISPRLFTMMVLMALATTIATSPLLALLGRKRDPFHRIGKPAVPAAAAVPA